MDKLLKKIRAISKLLVDAGLMQADIQELQSDPAMRAELDKSPLLKARLEDLSAEWRSIEEDIEALRH